jgi:DNA repair protein RecO (recombination protein O)
MGILQPLFLLEIDAEHKPGREVQRLRDFKSVEVYHSIPFDIVKSTMTLLLSEILYKVLRNEEADPTLFNFIFDSLQYFDSMSDGAANFHLWFLLKLIEYLGFKLRNNHSEKNVWFDIKAGCFVSLRPTFPKTPDTEESNLLSHLINLNVNDFHELNINGEKRSRILEIIIDYYTFHIEGIGTINSLQVLKEIFH